MKFFTKEIFRFLGDDEPKEREVELVTLVSEEDFIYIEVDGFLTGVSTKSVYNKRGQTLFSLKRIK